MSLFNLSFSSYLTANSDLLQEINASSLIWLMINSIFENRFPAKILLL